jgi:hypothetical protein
MNEQEAGQILFKRLEKHTRLTQLRGEARDLGKKFEELGRRLQKVSEQTTHAKHPKSPQNEDDREKAKLEEFLRSMKGPDDIESYEPHLSKATYGTIAKLKAEIPQTEKELAELNEKLEPYGGPLG